MLPGEAQAMKEVILKEARSAANTADATGVFTAIPVGEGTIVVIQQTGAITGTLAGTIETAEAANGLNNLALTPDDGSVFTSVSGANNVQKKVFNARQNRGYMKYIGTVGTGPVLLAVTALYRPKETT